MADPPDNAPCPDAAPPAHASDPAKHPTGMLAPAQADPDLSQYLTDELGSPPQESEPPKYPTEPLGAPPRPPTPEAAPSPYLTGAPGWAAPAMAAGGGLGLGRLATDRLEGADDLAPVLYRCPVDGETLELLVDARQRPACRDGHAMRRVRPPEAADSVFGGGGPR